MLPPDKPDILYINIFYIVVKETWYMERYSKNCKDTEKWWLSPAPGKVADIVAIFAAMCKN